MEILLILLLIWALIALMKTKNFSIGNLLQFGFAFKVI
jgi:hypothetical protein